MTQAGRVVTLLLALALLAACGKYGEPVRPGQRPPPGGVSGVTGGHPADCEDPEHDHE